jgi:hypothetical protein
MTTVKWWAAVPLVIAKTKTKVKMRSISDTQANLMVTSRKMTMMEKAY